MIAIVGCAHLYSCNDEKMIGGVPYRWKDVNYIYDYKKESAGNVEKYYVVPQEGGTYTFVCENYILEPPQSHFSSYYRYDINENGIDSVPFIDTKLKANTFTITVHPNDTITRYFYTCFKEIEAYGSIAFVQEGAVK